MSADLFAAFASPSAGLQNQQAAAADHTTKTAIPISRDPFAFPAPAPNTSSSNNATPWPSTQQPNSNQFAQWPTINQPHQQPTPPPLLKPQHHQQHHQQHAEDEDDDAWGDFEEAPRLPPPPIKLSSAGLADLVAPSKAEPNSLPKPRMIRVPTLDLVTNNLVDFGKPSLASPPPVPPPSATLSVHSSVSAASTAKQQTPQKPQIDNDPNVLFDAEDFELQEGDGQDEDAAWGAEDDTDGFGEFQNIASGPAAAPATAQPPAPALAQVPSRTMADLASLDLGQPLPSDPYIAAATTAGKTRRPAPSNLPLSTHVPDSEKDTVSYPQAPKSPFESFRDRKPDAMKQLSVKTPLTAGFPDKSRPRTSSPATAWPGAKSSDEGTYSEEEWAEFIDLPSAASASDLGSDDDENTASSRRQEPEASAKTAKTAKDSNPAGGWEWTGWEEADGQQTAGPSAPAGPPPTNVPPPSILLSVFPPLLELANTSLMKPLSSQPPAVRDRVLSDPATARFLRGYLALATVAARIISGRKARWHRDKFLSQGMAIAAAGNKGGMKLSAVDKSQSTREDREAEDVLAVWKQHVGPLRSAVAAANATAAKSKGGPAAAAALKLPELGGPNLAAHPAGAKVGVAAPKACALCGLKRDERIVRVDFDVEDSFGEWWVEHWGHRTCRNWWGRFEGRLRQR